MVLICPTDQLISLFAYMNIYACFFFLNTLTASVYTPRVDPCFLRAPPCHPPWDVLPLSFARSAFLAACHSPTNKEEECDTTSRNTNGVTLSMSSPPLLSNYIVVFPLCGYFLYFIFLQFCLCQKCTKFGFAMLVPLSTFDTNTDNWGQQQTQPVFPHSFYRLIDFCDCVSPSFSRGHRPHHSAVVLRLHLQARGPSQHPALRQGRDGEVLPGRDN